MSVTKPFVHYSQLNESSYKKMQYFLLLRFIFKDSIWNRARTEINMNQYSWKRECDAFRWRTPVYKVRWKCRQTSLVFAHNAPAGPSYHRRVPRPRYMESRYYVLDWPVLLRTWKPSSVSFSSRVPSSSLSVQSKHLWNTFALSEWLCVSLHGSVCLFTSWQLLSLWRTS